MSSKKPDINKARLVALKKVGILSDIDARKPLSKSQKEKIRKSWKKNHDIATAPKGIYKTQNISHYETREKRILEKSGYRIINDKVYIPLQGYDTAKIKRTSAYFGSGAIEIQRQKGERKTEIEFVGTSKKKSEWRDRLLSEYESGSLGENQWIGLKLYENGQFRHVFYQSMADIFKYLEDDFQPDKRTRETKKELLNNIHLVLMKTKSISDLDANLKDHKQRGRENYHRKKKAKNTGTKKLIGKVKRK